MSLDNVIDNLRRTLEDRTFIDGKHARVANRRLLVVQAQAVIREYDAWMQDINNLMYPNLLVEEL